MMMTHMRVVFRCCEMQRCKDFKAIAAEALSFVLEFMKCLYSKEIKRSTGGNSMSIEARIPSPGAGL